MEFHVIIMTYLRQFRKLEDHNDRFNSLERKLSLSYNLRAKLAILPTPSSNAQLS
jgi:hypothetical protein